MSEYKEYIDSISKKELKELIIGTKEIPPLLTRDEPTYSRPQLIWAMNKLYKEANGKFVEGKIGFKESEDFVKDIMNTIERMPWDKFYNYDYLRFDVKKPSLYYVIGILIFALIGIIECFTIAFNLVF